MSDWGIERRRTGQSGDHGTFRQVQVLGIFPEIRSGGSLHSICPFSQIYLVEVHGENFIFGISSLDINSEKGLFEFPDNGLFRGQEKHLCQLLSQCASAFNDLHGFNISPEGPQYSFDIQSEMLIKARILYCNEGLNKGTRNFLKRNRDTTFDEKRPDGAPVIRKDSCHSTGFVNLQSFDLGQVLGQGQKKTQTQSYKHGRGHRESDPVPVFLPESRFQGHNGRK